MFVLFPDDSAAEAYQSTHFFEHDDPVLLTNLWNKHALLL